VKRQTRAYSRDERKAQVVTAILIALGNGRENRFTTTELAYKLDISRSTKFNAMLSEMVNDGILGQEIESFRGAVATRSFYWLLDEKGGALKAKKAPRKITFNHKGKQLEVEL